MQVHDVAFFIFGGAGAGEINVSVENIKSAVGISVGADGFGRNKLNVDYVNFLVVVRSTLFRNEFYSAFRVALDAENACVARLAGRRRFRTGVGNGSTRKFRAVKRAFNYFPGDVVGAVGILVSARSVYKIQIITVLNGAAAVADNRVIKTLRAFDADFVDRRSARAARKSQHAYKSDGYYCNDFFHLCCNSKN